MFHHDMRSAISLLGKAADNDKDHAPLLASAAIALSGYNPHGENSSLWADTCGELLTKFDSPYLRAAFSFLVGGPDFKVKRVVVGRFGGPSPFTHCGFPPLIPMTGGPARKGHATGRPRGLCLPLFAR